jgi:four helix bundle protein
MFEHELEERCHRFALNVRAFTRKLKRDLENQEDIRQLVKSSGSIGANYIEANENVGKADLRFRLKISRKEAKESMHFLGLINVFGNELLVQEKNSLIDEANQLRKIFSSIIMKQVINSG